MLGAKLIRVSKVAAEYKLGRWLGYNLADHNPLCTVLWGILHQQLQWINQIRFVVVQIYHIN